MQGYKFKITPELLAEVEDMASLGMFEKDIALCLGITPQWLSEKKAENVELAEAIKRGNAKGLHSATKALRTCIEDKQIAAIIYYLKVKHGWKEQDQDNSAEQIRKDIADLKETLKECKTENQATT